MLVTSPETEKALLVGINKYPGASLDGCVNDVNDMANRLVDSYGWDPANIRLLVDERATRGEILKRILWLIDVKRGARVFFHQSGHGVQWPSRSHSGEPDGLLEAFCPVDFWWGLEGMITDKQYVDLFSRIPKHCEFTWVNDSCHSGDLTRAVLGNPHDLVHKPRAYPVPADIAWRHRGLKSRNINGNSRAMVCGKLDVGFVSGCKSHQTSADTVVNGRPCGALTHYLLETLARCANMSLKDIVKITHARLHSLGYTQEPQAEGRRVNRVFMSMRPAVQGPASLLYPAPTVAPSAPPGTPGATGAISDVGPTGPVSEHVGVAHGNYVPFDEDEKCPTCGK